MSGAGSLSFVGTAVGPCLVSPSNTEGINNSSGLATDDTRTHRQKTPGPIAMSLQQWAVCSVLPPPPCQARGSEGRSYPSAQWISPSRVQEWEEGPRRTPSLLLLLSGP